MNDELTTLYRRLLKEYTADTLKTISARIISSYQKRRYDSLAKYARRLTIEGYDDPRNIGKIFVRIIKNYHPDKLNSILLNIRKAYQEKDLEGLRGYARRIGLAGYVDKNEESPRREKKYDIDIEEQYVYGEKDFDFHDDLSTDDVTDYETDLSQEEYFEDDDEDEDGDDEVFGFKEAIHEEFLGNLVDDEVYIHPKDLIELEELILSDRGIMELSGIEYCHNLTILDLSDNDIIDIRPLAKLRNLTILDLSNNYIETVRHLSDLENLISLNLSKNEIDTVEPLAYLQKLIYLDISNNGIKDIGSLINLASLKYLNITGNRIADDDAITALKSKGVNIYR